MVWGGVKEQEEKADGNANTKNWYNDTLQVVKNTMREYWQAGSLSHNAPAVISPLPNPSTSLESDYDRHCRQLIMKNQCENRQVLGWAGELRQYLTVVDDVMKDTDVVDWWAVSPCIVSIVLILNQSLETCCDVPNTCTHCKGYFHNSGILCTM